MIYAKKSKLTELYGICQTSFRHVVRSELLLDMQQLRDCGGQRVRSFVDTCPSCSRK